MTTPGGRSILGFHTSEGEPGDQFALKHQLSNLQVSEPFIFLSLMEDAKELSLNWVISTDTYYEKLK